MSAATLHAERLCRCDCRRPVVVAVTAVSGSGRRWTSYACEDREHQAGAERTMEMLGFAVETVHSVISARAI